MEEKRDKEEWEREVKIRRKEKGRKKGRNKRKNKESEGRRNA